MPRVRLSRRAQWHGGRSSRIDPRLRRLCPLARRGFWQGQDGERLWSYWRDQLAGELPVLNLPTDFPRQRGVSSRGNTVTLPLDRRLVQPLRNRAKAEGVTLFTLALAAFQTLLHRHSGQNDILVGVPAIARGRAEFERVAGYFVNMLMIRADLSGDPSFQSFLGQVRRTVVAALEHQDFPFPLLVERLRPAHDHTSNPLFQVGFAIQKASQIERTPNLEELSLEPMELERHVTPFDLDWTLHEHGDDLRIAVQYSADLFDADTIQRMAQHFADILAEVAAYPERHLSELPGVSDDERGS